MNGVMVQRECSSGSILETEDSTVQLIVHDMNDMNVEENSSCFTNTCQDYACISFIFLVGAITLVAGIALCVINLSSCLLGSILVVLGSLLLVVALSSTCFLCTNYCKNAKMKALEAAIEKKEKEYDIELQKIRMGASENEITSSTEKSHHLDQTYQSLCKLYQQRENMEQRKKKKGWSTTRRFG